MLFKNTKFSKNITADVLANYLEELNNFYEANIWYQKAYDLTKDEKYLTKIQENKLKSKNQSKDILIQNDKKIFPILNNFAKKEQVINVLESYKYIFFAANDKSIKMYDKKNSKFLKEFRTWVSNGMAGNSLQMAFDENRELLYFSVLNSIKDVSKNDLIHVLDVNNGKIIKTLKNSNGTKNTYLNISNDGKYLVAINDYNLFNIINVEDNKVQHYNFNGKGKFLAATIYKEKDDYIINIVNSDNKLYKFSLKLARNTSVEDFNYQMNFKRYNENLALKIFDHINSVEIKNISINSRNNIEVKLPNKIKEFDLENILIKDLEKFTPYINEKKSTLAINQKYDGRVIEFVNIKNNYKKEYFLTRGVNVLNAYPINNKYILLITSDISFMPILNDKGEVMASLQGFNTLPKKIYIKDKKLIVLGNDNVINIFNLDILNKLKYNDKEYDDEVLVGFGNLTGDSKEEIIESFENMKKYELLNYQKTNSLSFIPTTEQMANNFKLFAIKKELIYPQLSTYIKNEKDWIMYTPEGLFTYGGEGYKLLKYHQNQGLFKEAKIIENEKLYDKFYRPDLIKKILAGEKVDIPLDVKSVIQNIKPPELKILSNNMINKKDVDLTYQICDAGNGVSNPKLLINGKAINPPSSRGFSIKKVEEKENKCKIYKSIHTLNPGKNKISVKAYDKDKNIASESEAIEVTANYKINKKPNLYFLSIAVSDYNDDSYDLKYPVNDVIKIKEKIEQKSKSVYKNIYTYEVHDSKVSHDNINKVFDEISKKIEINDAFILYIAGHGVTKDGLYQFVPHNTNNKISINEIKKNLSKINTNKSLVLLDTCQSGAIIDEVSTVNRLSKDDNRNYIVASSSDQVALEGYKNHGVFSYSVLDGFEKAYFAGDDELLVYNLGNYVKRLVPKLTKKEFYFEQKPEFYFADDFVLGDKN